MLVVTFTALIQKTISICTKLFVTGGFVFLVDGLQLIIAILLMVLGVMVAFSCFSKLFKAKKVA
jgi:carbon starvation protein